MSISDATCWTLIRGAAEGRQRDREAFARRYERVIRAYFGARWRGTRLLSEIDDATQEVFIDCFREGGALTRASPGGERAFRAFLYGVVKNIARRVEHARARAGLSLSSSLDLPSREEELAVAFDRAWARTLLRRAASLHRVRAHAAGADARRRVDLLLLRFQEGLPIREIARLWETDASRLHHEYAKARREFREALRDVVKEHVSDPHGEVERECERLLSCF